jgi:hypothetical protein
MCPKFMKTLRNIFPFVRCGTTKNYSISLMIAEIELWLMQEAHQRVHQEQKLIKLMYSQTS